jgi:hypothetical protein
MEPKRGCIALCSKGAKGLITSEEPELIRFQNGVEQFVWKGIYIEDIDGHKIGDQWYSQDPNIIDDRILEGLRTLYEAAHAVYSNDDAFVERCDKGYDDMEQRDNELGLALSIVSKILRIK